VNISRTMAMTILVASISLVAHADSEHSGQEQEMTSHSMPEKGMGGMPMMKKMQGKQAMMQAHMSKMETHLANIEALLKQLVELQQK